MQDGSRASGSNCKIRELPDRSEYFVGKVADIISTGRTGAAARIATGSAAAVGHAPFSLPLLALLAFSLAIWMHASSTSAKAAFRTGWMIGFGYFLIVLIWIIEPFLVHPERHGWMAPLALLIAPFCMALFWAAAFRPCLVNGKLRRVARDRSGLYHGGLRNGSGSCLDRISMGIARLYLGRYPRCPSCSIIPGHMD